MPTLAFGLKTAASRPGISKPAQKRKAVFDEEIQDDDEENDAFLGLQKPKGNSSRTKPLLKKDPEPARKSPKLSGSSTLSKSTPAEYTNLSALRSAKLHDKEASQIDASVYEYDAVYDTFQAPKESKKASGESTGPKYMSSLLQSADIRKRDQLRAKEKLLQRERDAEGDKFADKEKFVTGAYKKQQEENRRLEEEEEKREAEEEERRRKGGGMTDFNKNLLRKEEERQRAIEQATEEAKRKREAGEALDTAAQDGTDLDENQMAAELNQKGANIVVNDDGEIVDKRQLLSAGLNVAPKPRAETHAVKTPRNDVQQQWRRSEKAQDTRMSQRERQTRMVERQIEELAEKQRQEEEAERQALEEKNKSKLTDETKMSAKERYLQRKKEREEQAKEGKSGG